jgi:outer membrane protein, heavy metal efflux system
MHRSRSRVEGPTLALLLCSLTLAWACAGCVLAPEGTQAERDALESAGTPFERPFPERELPELPSPAGWRDVLQRAFLANGELEAAWFEWSAAVSRVSIAAGYPNTNLAPSFSYLLSGGGMKAWDRTTIEIGFDPMANLALPVKVRKAGQVALEEARATGRRFEAAKFRVQRTVLEGYLELALAQEQLRIARESLSLAEIGAETSARRVEAGGMEREATRAWIAAQKLVDEVRNLESEVRARRAALNGLLARAPDAPLVLPEGLPEARPIPADDAALIAAGVEANPELEALAHETLGRADALELARLHYLPDFNPFFSFTGSVEQVLGAGVTLPTTLPQIRAGVEEARAMLRASEALARQSRSDRAAGFVAALVALRNSERQSALFERSILPAAEQMLASARPAYAAGSASLLDLLDAQRALLEVRSTLAEARIEREKRLAELEELAGLDVETLGAPAGERAGLRTAHSEVGSHE